MDRIQLLDLIFSELKNGVGVEVGTFKGQFSKEILKRWNGKLYMVDVWNELGDEYIDTHLTNVDVSNVSIGDLCGPLDEYVRQTTLFAQG